jgi:hypothetical protein
MRSVTNDVSKLCEFALPFMTVLAMCCLVATSGVCNETLTRRRGVESFDTNATSYVETVANFVETYHINMANATHSSYMSRNSTILSPDSSLTWYTLIFISPFITFWLIRVLIVAIITGHSTEFITAFILVTSTRYSIAHAMNFWSVLASSGAGFAFVLILFVKRD